MASSPPPPRASSSDALDGDVRRQARKLQKKRRDFPSSTPEFPEHLRDSDDSDSEDRSHATPMSINMNQSIFGLIAAAGSRVDFNTRFEGNSSDEEETQDLSQTTILDPSEQKRKSEQKKKLSKHRLLKSFATLPKRKSKSTHEPSRLSQPDQDGDDSSDTHEPPTAPTVTLSGEDNRIAPVMSRILQAEEEMSSRPSFDIERISSDLQNSVVDVSESTPLARRLMEIFEFDEPERVIEGELLSFSIILLRLNLTSRRISLLAPAKCPITGIPIYHGEAYLFLRILTKESGLSFSRFSNAPVV